MSIKIEIIEESAEMVRERMLGLLGLTRNEEAAAAVKVALTRAPQSGSELKVFKGDDPLPATVTHLGAEPISHVVGVADVAPATSDAAPKRERGKPSPGRKRRTKEEIAEDEAAEYNERVQAKADAAVEELSISTGENRVGPEDDPETEAQDAADEAAESAATDLPLIEVLRKRVGEYRAKFGMPAAVALCAEGGLIGCGMADVPEADLPAVIAKVEAALAGEPTAEPEAPAKPATKEDVAAAMKRYAKRFDGQDSDMTKMPACMTDMPKLFVELFGPGVEKLSQIPADGYGRALAAIDEAIASNRFGRA